MSLFRSELFTKTRNGGDGSLGTALCALISTVGPYQDMSGVCKVCGIVVQFLLLV